MSNVAKRFLKENNIALEEGQVRVFETKDINKILAEYGIIYNFEEQKYICIRDIVGFDYSWRGDTNDLYYNFNSYFNDMGDSYHSRANGMLNYLSSDIVEKLMPSFKSEPMKVLEVEDGKCIIYGNGIHRFNILKVSYLGEISKCTSKEKLEEVNKKFTIPVALGKIDIFKSYCNYLLNKFKKNPAMNYWIEVLEDPNICSVSYNKTKETLTNEELLNFIIDNTELEMIESDLELARYILDYDSFNSFISNYMELTKERKLK